MYDREKDKSSNLIGIRTRVSLLVSQQTRQLTH